MAAPRIGEGIKERRSSPAQVKPQPKVESGLRPHMLPRALTGFYIMLCFAMGLVLLFVPWLPNWTGNFFAHHYSWVDALARNDYLRGGISGIGLADIGLGIYETGRFRKRSGSFETAPRPSPEEPPVSAPR